jgi:hypothetical protein
MRNDGVGAVGGLPLAVYSGRIALVLLEVGVPYGCFLVGSSSRP